MLKNSIQIEFSSLFDEPMAGSRTRSVELWSSCDESGTKLTQQNFVSSDGKYRTTDEPSNPWMREICHMTHGLDQNTINAINDIRGYDSVAALRVGKHDGTR